MVEPSFDEVVRAYIRRNSKAFQDRDYSEEEEW